MKKCVNSRLRPALWMAVGVMMLAAACKNDADEVIRTFNLKVKLEYPEGYAPAKDVSVSLRKANADNVDEAKTNVDGVAEFTVVAGIYESASSELRVLLDDVSVLNGIKSNITISDGWKDGDTVRMPLTASKTSKLVIKELYVGGCQKDDLSGAFQRDPYMILYNNSNADVSVANLAFGTAFPHNAHATSYFTVGDELIYKDEDWMPAAYGVWALQGNPVIGPGKQLVIAMNSANNHTEQYSNSVNLANAEYYVAYDPESGYNNTTFHPSPSELIPAAQYLKAYRLPGVTSNAWTFSVLSPAFYIFVPEVPLETFAFELNNITYHRAPGTTGTSQSALKIPRNWILDGVEVFAAPELANSKKRFTPDIDAGYIGLTNSQGYTLYRNVHKEATEALPENAGKLVYNYSLGTEGSTDPSGIDAEASIKNGAHIIYKDTNNTTADFHQRSRASLRD